MKIRSVHITRHQSVWLTAIRVLRPTWAQDSRLSDHGRPALLRHREAYSRFGGEALPSGDEWSILPMTASLLRCPLRQTKQWLSLQLGCNDDVRRAGRDR